MRITAALLGEHGVLYGLFAALEETLPQVEDQAEAQRWAGLLGKVLTSHAQLENEILFPAVERQLGPIGPLTVMRMEHEEIEETLGQALQVETPKEVRRLVQHVLQVAREHFAKEEHVLFPLADRALDEGTLEDLAYDWAERRRVAVTEQRESS